MKHSLIEPLEARIAPATFTISSGMSLSEGQAGKNSLTFTVTLSEDVNAPVTVDFATFDGTATVGDGDFEAVSGTLTFNPGERVHEISVPILGDTKFESDETFVVRLSAPSGDATLGQPSESQGTILNDDARPTISVSTASVLEGGPSDSQANHAVFTVSLSNPSSEEVTVTFQTADGTAKTADLDYTAHTEVVRFAPGQTSQEVSVVVGRDNKFETNETFKAGLSNAVNGSIFAAGESLGTILNDDTRPTISIQETTVGEGNPGLAAANQLTFTVNLSNPSSETVTVNFQTLDDTATVADGDYTPKTQSLSFAPGETSKTVSVNVGKDEKFEADETVKGVLSSPSNASLGTAQAVGVILNDDGRPTISVLSSSLSEGGAGAADVMTFEVRLSNPSSETVSVMAGTLMGAGDTAQAGSDYVARSGVALTFNPGEVVKTFTVTLKGDLLDEGDETFTVQLANPSNATIATPEATGTILNDDILVRMGNATAGESAGTVEFELKLSTASSHAVTVKYNTVNGTAVAGEDFTATSGMVIFQPGETSQKVVVAVLDDTVAEERENFSLQLAEVTGAKLSNTGATGTIVDNDLGFRIDDVQIVEGGAGGTSLAVFQVTLLNAVTGKTYAVDAATADGTAKVADGDYVSKTGTLTFSSASTATPEVTTITRTFVVEIKGETLVEANETFQVKLTSPREVVGAGPVALNGALVKDSAVGTILNDDGSANHLVFTVGDVTITEGDSGSANALFVVRLVGGTLSSGTTASLEYQTADGSATSAGANPDFTSTAGSLTFSGTTVQQVIKVPILGDLTQEGAENFLVKLLNVTFTGGGDDTGFSFLRETATGTIVDNGDSAPLVSISPASLVEGSAGDTGYMHFEVSLSKVASELVTVQFLTQNGTAVAGSDFVAPNNGFVTFEPGQTKAIISIPILGDDGDEADETFSVRLSAPTGATLGAASSATGTIQNDEVQFSVENVSVVEGDGGTKTVLFQVSINQAPVGHEVRVNFATQDGAAISTGSTPDYVAKTGTLTFAAGTTSLSQTVAVTINGDTRSEIDEQFFLNLFASVNATVVSGKEQASATIVNDDAAPKISIQDASITEGAAGAGKTMTFQVQLDKASEAPVTVLLSTENGTALAAQDYTAVTGQLVTFQPGQVTQTFSVPILGDAKDEPTETFKVKLASPSNGIIDRGEATATILDDDARVVTISGGSLVEGNGGGAPRYLDFTVSLSAAADQDTSVLVSTADGSAISSGVNADYVAKSETVTFLKGETTKTFRVEVVGDIRSEGTEQFSVNLASPDKLVLGASSSASGVILDDETTVQLVAIGSTTINEEGGAGAQTFMEFDVIRSGDSSRQVTVQYQTVDGTAKGSGAQADFTATSGTLTFAAGSTSAGHIRVPITADANYERDETFQVRLFNPINAAVMDGAGTAATTAQTVTIVNNDVAPTISVADESVTEGSTGRAMTFKVRLSATNEVDVVTIKYAVGDDATPGATSARAVAADGFLQDYQVSGAASGTLTFQPGELEKIITLTVNGDLRDEADAETLAVTLSDQKNGTVSVSDGTKLTAIGTILDDDAAPTVRFKEAVAGNIEVTEGNSGTVAAKVVLELSEISERVIKVGVATTAQTAVSTGANPDYTALPAGFVAVSTPGEKEFSFVIDVHGDELKEANETFKVSLSAPENVRLVEPGSSLQVTILDDDTAPLITVNDVSIVEGDSGTTEMVFTVTRSALSGLPVSVEYQTVDGTAHSTGALPDFIAKSGKITFGADELSREVRIQIVGDTYKEASEKFSLRLFNPTNGVTASTSSTGEGTILADGDAVVGLTISDGFSREGTGNEQAIIFTVELTSPADTDTVIKATTRSGTAVRGVDFESLVGRSVTIPAGETSAEVRVGMRGDTVFEPTENFFVDLRSIPAGLQVVDGTARGVIYNDDLRQLSSRSIQYIDVDGDLVTVHVSKGSLSPDNLVFGDVNSIGGRQLRAVVLTNDGQEFQNANLSIKAGSQDGFPGNPLGRQGDRHVHVGSIVAAVPQNDIQQFVNGIDLGAVTVDGDLGKIIVGDNFATAALQSLTVRSLGKLGTKTQQKSASDTTNYDVLSQVLGPVSSLHVTGDFGGIFQVIGAQYGRIDSLYVGGALTSTTASSAGRILFTGKIINGYVNEIRGSAGDFSGLINGTTTTSKIGQLSVGVLTGGKGASSGQIFASRIDSLSVGKIQGGAGAQSGRVLSNNLQKLVIAGGILGGAGTDAGEILADKIGTLSVGGALRGSSGAGSGSILSSAGIVEATIKHGITGGTGSLSGSIRTGKGVGSLALGGVTGGSGDNSGVVLLGGPLDKLRIFGDVRGGTGNGSGGVDVDGKLSDAVLGGNLIGGNSRAATPTQAAAALVKSGFVVARSIDSLYLNGNLEAGEDFGTGLALSGTIRSESTIGFMRIHGSVLGSASSAAIISAPGQAKHPLAIRSLVIDGSAKFAEILAGYDANATAALERGAEVNADARIGTVKIGQTMKSSSIVAGTSAGTDGLFGTADDHLMGGTGVRDVAAAYSKIAKIIIGGTPQPGTVSAGIVAQGLGSVRAGSITYPLTPGAGNDLNRAAELGAGSGIRIFELPLPV